MLSWQKFDICNKRCNPKHMCMEAILNYNQYYSHYKMFTKLRKKKPINHTHIKRCRNKLSLILFLFRIQWRYTLFISIRRIFRPTFLIYRFVILETRCNFCDFFLFFTFFKFNIFGMFAKKITEFLEKTTIDLLNSVKKILTRFYKQRKLTC